MYGSKTVIALALVAVAAPALAYPFVPLQYHGSVTRLMHPSSTGTFLARDERALAAPQLKDLEARESFYLYAPFPIIYGTRLKHDFVLQRCPQRRRGYGRRREEGWTWRERPTGRRPHGSRPPPPPRRLPVGSVLRFAESRLVTRISFQRGTR